MWRAGPIAPLNLAVEERETLEGWAHLPKAAQPLAQRARIVVECSTGQSQHRARRQARGDLPDSRQVAPTVGVCASPTWRGVPGRGSSSKPASRRCLRAAAASSRGGSSFLKTSCSSRTRATSSGFTSIGPTAR